MVSTNTKLAEALRKGRGLLPDASLMSDDELAWDLEAAAVLAEFDAAKGEAMNNDPDWLNNQSFRDQAAYEALAAHDAEQAQAAKAVPAGFVLVPVEFIEAGQRIAQDYARTNPKWPMWDNGEAEPKVQDPCGAHAWLERAAMLAAAPTPPAPEAPPYRMTAGEVDAMNRALTRSVRFVDEAQAQEAQQPAGQELPSLPYPQLDSTPAFTEPGYTADQMHAYARDALAARPAGFVLVPVEVLEDAATAIGHFVSDHGWSDEDMQAMDNLDAYIARHKANAAPATPGPAPDCED